MQSIAFWQVSRLSLQLLMNKARSDLSMTLVPLVSELSASKS